MTMQRVRVGWPLVLGLLVLLGVAPGAVSQAMPLAHAAPADWELTSLGALPQRLFLPASGVLFVQTASDVERSDDGGATWAPVALGPATMLLATDPLQHTTLYAAGADGVYKTTDDAHTWQQIFAYGPTVGGKALALAASPADRNLLYLGLAGSLAAEEFHFFRSRDGGATWQQLEQQHFSLCSWNVLVLQPHPSDARRVFRAADCIAGRNVGESLAESTDMGQTWTPVFNAQPFSAPFLGYPERLVGGQGRAPQRFYLAVNRDRRVGGSSVVRSDDDGASWDEVLAYHGGGTPGFSPPGEDPNAPNVQLGGLAYDPAQPDQVYIGRQVFLGYFEPASGGAVAASRDGGATWFGLGRQDIGAVSDLALSVDGGTLLAATDQGLWRLQLAAIGK